MTRNRQSSRAAGTSFETLMATFFRAHIDDRIERRQKYGAKDRGDIAAVRCFKGGRVVIECKDESGVYAGRLGQWMDEAELERGNDDAVACAVVAKRRATRVPGRQWVIMTADDLVTLLTGERPMPGWRAA
jgi:hypothetical protein